MTYNYDLIEHPPHEYFRCPNCNGLSAIATSPDSFVFCNNDDCVSRATRGPYCGRHAGGDGSPNYCKICHLKIEYCGGKVRAVQEGGSDE
ncbi:hypothetical protein LCGC14_2176130 [marine sediment metagenome]|uniref:Uncharacterized protein n=1 Tax=marine sediment metagenome TaxID=412755 RepID=A0A0F9GJG5_9ZZZZ